MAQIGDKKKFMPWNFPTWNLSDYIDDRLLKIWLWRNQIKKWPWENKTKSLNLNTLPEMLRKIILVWWRRSWIQGYILFCALRAPPNSLSCVHVLTYGPVYTAFTSLSSQWLGSSLKHYKSLSPWFVLWNLYIPLRTESTYCKLNCHIFLQIPNMTALSFSKDTLLFMYHPVEVTLSIPTSTGAKLKICYPGHIFKTIQWIFVPRLLYFRCQVLWAEVGKKSGYRNTKERLTATEKVRVGGGKPYAPKSL